jgi:hypothetical protein
MPFLPFDEDDYFAGSVMQAVMSGLKGGGLSVTWAVCHEAPALATNPLGTLLGARRHRLITESSARTGSAAALLADCGGASSMSEFQNIDPPLPTPVASGQSNGQAAGEAQSIRCSVHGEQPSSDTACPICSNEYAQAQARRGEEEAARTDAASAGGEPFVPLAVALVPWLSTQFSDLPDDVQRLVCWGSSAINAHVGNRGTGSLFMNWDGCGPDRRRALAQHWDDEHDPDPVKRKLRADSWRMANRIDAVESGPCTDATSRDRRLERLERQLAEIDVEWAGVHKQLGVKSGEAADTASGHAETITRIVLTKASDDEIHAALTKVYDYAAKQGMKPPNVKEVIPPVQSILRKQDREASGVRIDKLNEHDQHKRRRGDVGVRVRGTFQPFKWPEM